jgi:hypothetical protein
VVLGLGWTSATSNAVGVVEDEVVADGVAPDWPNAAPHRSAKMQMPIVGRNTVSISFRTLVQSTRFPQLLRTIAMHLRHAFADAVQYLGASVHTYNYEEEAQ